MRRSLFLLSLLSLLLCSLSLVQSALPTIGGDNNLIDSMVNDLKNNNPIESMLGKGNNNANSNIDSNVKVVSTSAYGNDFDPNNVNGVGNQNQNQNQNNKHGNHGEDEEARRVAIAFTDLTQYGLFCRYDNFDADQIYTARLRLFNNEENKVIVFDNGRTIAGNQEEDKGHHAGVDAESAAGLSTLGESASSIDCPFGGCGSEFIEVEENQNNNKHGGIGGGIAGHKVMSGEQVSQKEKKREFRFTDLMAITKQTNNTAFAQRQIMMKSKHDKYGKKKYSYNSTEEEEAEEEVWSEYEEYEFKKPVNLNDTTIQYATNQVIVECAPDFLIIRGQIQPNPRIALAANIFNDANLRFIDSTLYFKGQTLPGVCLIETGGMGL